MLAGEWIKWYSSHTSLEGMNIDRIIVENNFTVCITIENMHTTWINQVHFLKYTQEKHLHMYTKAHNKDIYWCDKKKLLTTKMSIKKWMAKWTGHIHTMEYCTRVEKPKYCMSIDTDMESYWRHTTEWKLQAANLTQYHKFFTIWIYVSMCMSV